MGLLIVFKQITSKSKNFIVCIYDFSKIPISYDTTDICYGSEIYVWKISVNFYINTRLSPPKVIPFTANFS